MKKKDNGKQTGKVALETRDQYTVVLEDLRSQFKVFGESLALTREVFSRQVEEIKESIKKIEERIFYLERANLELLKEIRENTISRSEFEELRAKVRQLEAKISK